MSLLPPAKTDRSESDQSSARFLWVNIALAVFILLAHGGGLAVSIAKPEQAPKDIWAVAICSLPVALGVLISGVFALRRPGLAPRVLSLHGYVLGASAVVMLIWAVSVLLSGPGESRFVWTVGFLTGWVAYSMYVMLRFSPKFKSAPRSAFYVVTLLALCVDVGVFSRLMSSAP